MMGKLIIGASLVWGSMGARCTRTTWEAMLVAIDELKPEDSNGMFLRGDADLGAMMIESSLEVVTEGRSADFACTACFIAKYSTLYDVFKGSDTRCATATSTTCKALMDGVNEKFVVCESLYVDPPSSYAEMTAIADVVAAMDKPPLAKSASTAAAFVRLVKAKVKQVVADVDTQAVWPCFEARETAKYPVYAGTATPCNATKLPVGCLDFNSLDAQLQECTNAKTAPPKIVSTPQQKQSTAGAAYTVGAGAGATAATAGAVAGVTVGVAATVLAAAVVAAAAATRKEAELDLPMRMYDFYECYEQYWVGVFPVWTEDKEACTAVNTPSGCVDETALATARDACLAKAPAANPNYCSASEQATAVSLVAARNFTSDDFSDANDNVWTMVYSYLSELRTNGTLGENALNESCVSCLINHYASTYNIEAKMDADCKSENPPVSCAQALAELDQIQANYDGCAVALRQANAVGSLSLIISLLVVIVSQIN